MADADLMRGLDQVLDGIRGSRPGPASQRQFNLVDSELFKSESAETQQAMLRQLQEANPQTRRYASRAGLRRREAKRANKRHQVA